MIVVITNTLQLTQKVKSNQYVNADIYFSTHFYVQMKWLKLQQIALQGLTTY
jgi:hypothetical protein